MFALSDYRDLVLMSGYALAFLSVVIFVYMLMQEGENVSAQENLRELEGKKTSNSLVRIARPVFSYYIVPALRGKKSLDKWRERYRRKIISAGLKNEITADEFMAFKVLLVVALPIVAGVLKSLGFLDLSTAYFPAFPVLGFIYPDLWVNGLITARHKQVLKSLPFVVDLLALSTEAGLDFIGAIAKVVEKASSSPLIDELEQVLKEIKVGSSRAEALKEMAARLNMQEVNSFIAVLVSADQMGASIGKVLKQQSEQIRVIRFVRAEKAGAAAAQKLLLPTFLFIFPSIMLIVLGPYIVQAMSGGGN